MSKESREEPGHQLTGVCWVITTRCSLECPKCFAIQNLPDGEFEKQKQMVSILGDNGVKKLTFAGGDPLLVPHVIDLIEFAHDKGMDTALFSTGVGLDPDKIKRLNTGILTHLSLPLEGSTPEIHNLVMGSKNHHKIVTKLLPKVVNNKYNLEIATVVTSKNIDDLPSLGELLLKHEISKWKLFQFYPLGRGLENQDEFRVDKNLFMKRTTSLVKQFTEIDIDPQIGDEDKQSSYFNLGPKGNVFTAKGEEYIHMGNIFNTSPHQIWQNPGFNHERHVSRHWRDID
jgi:MoaA/NifB/PqqE/SkfB family radical SAM enzyme